MKAEQSEPRVERAAEWLSQYLRASSPALMPQIRRDVRALLATADGPEPDWADIREAARKAGYRISRTAKRRRNDRHVWLWYALDGDDPVGEFQKTTWATQVHLRGPKGYTALLEFTPAAVLAAARLVGLGGAS